MLHYIKLPTIAGKIGKYVINLVCINLYCITWTGAITAQGPPSNCSNAVDSDSLKTKPKRYKNENLFPNQN